MRFQHRETRYERNMFLKLQLDAIVIHPLNMRVFAPRTGTYA
ncbi:hypothetical protein V1280_003476 [Bradyrhizobium sp. AZCC 2230]